MTACLCPQLGLSAILMSIPTHHPRSKYGGQQNREILPYCRIIHPTLIAAMLVGDVEGHQPSEGLQIDPAQGPLLPPCEKWLFAVSMAPRRPFCPKPTWKPCPQWVPRIPPQPMVVFEDERPLQMARTMKISLVIPREIRRIDSAEIESTDTGIV